MIRFMAHTGARPGELCIAGRRQRDRGFTWEHWDPEASVNDLGQRVGLITLPPTHHKTGGKTGRPREIVVPPVLVRALERHRARDWAHPVWVFTHRRGGGAEARGATTAALGEPWTSHSLGIKVKVWRRRAIAAGVPVEDEGDNRFHLYRLRHSRITDLIGARGGLSHDQAAALTGTSGRMIETTYGHLTGTRLIALDQAARRRAGGR
jgi:integrase